MAIAPAPAVFEVDIELAGDPHRAGQQVLVEHVPGVGEQPTEPPGDLGRAAEQTLDRPLARRAPAVSFHSRRTCWRSSSARGAPRRAGPADRR